MSHSHHGGTAAAVLAIVALSLLAADHPAAGRAAVRKSAPAASQKSSPAQNVGLMGQGSQISVADPQHPNWTSYRLSINGFSADLPQNIIKGRDLTAIVYQRNRPVQKISAPFGTADTKQATIYAYGGVVVDYLTRPGSDLHADTVTWNAHTKQGVARGHVHFHYMQGRTVTAGVTPVLYFNTDGGIISSTPLAGGH